MTKRLTESQIVGILKEAEVGITVPKICRTHGVAKALFLSGDPGMAGWKLPISGASKSSKVKTGNSNLCMAI